MFGMIVAELSSRKLFSLFFLGIGFLFGVISSYLVYRKNPNYKGNQFTSLAFLLMGIASLTNMVYTFSDNELFVEILHRTTIIEAFLGCVFLFTAANFIYMGNTALSHRRKIILTVFSVIISITLLVLPGVTIYLDELGVDQFIVWTLPYYAIAGITTYIMSFGAIYEYHKILKDIPAFSQMKKALYVIISGIVVLVFGHFFMTVPHILLDEFDISTLRLIGNLGSMGIFLGFILIFIGFNTKVEDVE